jgi:hypothetical protein
MVYALSFSLIFYRLSTYYPRIWVTTLGFGLFLHTYCDVIWVKIDQDAVEYAKCEGVVKDFPPFMEAMKRWGIEDMDLVMVDPW